MSHVNFNLPAGSFSIDKDHRYFCFILCAIMPEDPEEADAFREIEADGVAEFPGGPAEE